MKLRNVLREIAPPALSRMVRSARGDALRWGGRPANWQDAMRASSGYASEEILERVSLATEQVMRGDACYERDSVVFHEPDYPFALVAALLQSALRHGGRLDVLDFGGSLGSRYWQCRPLLADIVKLRWLVVEQPNFAAVGQQRFANAQLSFVDSLARLDADFSPQVALASGVLHYLPEPYAVLDQLAATGAETLLIDRTPLGDVGVDRLYIQRVPGKIYQASYPCWIFSRSHLLRHVERRWRRVCEFACPDDGSARTDDGLDFAFRGLYLRAKT